MSYLPLLFILLEIWVNFNSSKIFADGCSCTNGRCVTNAANEIVCACNLGYTLSRKNPKICEPVCMISCINARCVQPDKCVCLDGYEHQEKNKYGYVCTPVCKERCINSVCSLPDQCACYDGYKKSKNNPYRCVNNREAKKEEKEARGGKGSNEFSNRADFPAGNEVITSIKKTNKTGGNQGGNKPNDSFNYSCENSCQNGVCDGFDFCHCNAGYLKNDGICVEDCLSEGSSCKRSSSLIVTSNCKVTFLIVLFVFVGVHVHRYLKISILKF